MKRYLITGASRGIGRAVAMKLATKNTELLLHGRDTVALAQTRKAVEPECAKVTLLIHDLATARGVSDLIAEVGRSPIDLLVNNAGIAIVKPFTEITSIEWEQTIGVNITAPFLLTQSFAPRMARRTARPQNSRDQCLSCRDRHRHLEPARGSMAARTNDERDRSS
jgi:short-subunit dehydrogenase